MKCKGKDAVIPRPATENVKSGDSQKPKNRGLSPRPKLTRTTFKTSREMDFFSARELITQTGHAVAEWPLVIAKELIDNALDACEEADIAPIIDVTADRTGITVRDNGPGLPKETLASALDFTIRASSREAYVSPTRGAQGNALKTLFPMPWVVDPEQGRMIVVTGGKRHVITCGCDPISQRAVVHDDVTDAPKCKKRTLAGGKRKQGLSSCGTEIRIEWGERTTVRRIHRRKANGNWVAEEVRTVEWPFGLCPLGTRGHGWSFADQLRQLVEGFAMLNPHAAITLNWFGNSFAWQATDTTWEKWKPSKPTSPHWYEQRHLERLIGAYVTHDREHGQDRLVSDFIAEFDGLAGSQKRSKVLTDTDLHRAPLSSLVDDNRFDAARIAALLGAMQKHSRPVKSKRLGIIGEDHLRERLLAMGIHPPSFQYRKQLSKDGLPGVLESAFGWLGEDANDSRRIYTGANWSAAIKNPFRSFGGTGEGLERTLAEMRATSNEPIVFVLHLAHPRIEFTDRGKSALLMDEQEHNEQDSNDDNQGWEDDE
ncbi:MAG: ATP-binding protein [Pirellulales bacterium]